MIGTLIVCHVTIHTAGCFFNFAICIMVAPKGATILLKSPNSNKYSIHKLVHGGYECKYDLIGVWRKGNGNNTRNEISNNEILLFVI